MYCNSAYKYSICVKGGQILAVSDTRKGARHMKSLVKRALFLRYKNERIRVYIRRNK